MRKIKIIYALTSLYPGGAENHTINLIRRFNPREFEPYLVATNQGGSLEKTVQDLGIPYCILSKKTKLRRETIQQLREIYRTFQPDIIHTQLFSADYVARQAADVVPAAVVISTIQNIEVELGAIRTLINRHLARKTDKFIAITQAVKDAAIKQFKYPTEKIVVINNVVDLSSFLYKARLAKGKNDKYLICAVGRLVPQKGMDTLIKALKNALATSKRDLRLNIIGEGELRPNLEKLARDLEIGDRVKFWGNRDDVASLLHKFDLFALTSNWEGLGNVFMEAMASGLPIVASRTGGIPEIVKDQRNGILVPPGDTEKTRQALLKIMGDPALYEKMSATNYHDAQERFNPKIPVRQHEQLYRGLVKST